MTYSETIGQFVEKAFIADLRLQWAEMTCERSDSLNYLSFHLYQQTRRHMPVLHIEYGVQGENARQPVGCYKATWSKETNSIVNEVLVMVNGQSGDVEEIVAQLHKYQELPVTSYETSSQS